MGFRAKVFIQVLRKRVLLRAGAQLGRKGDQVGKVIVGKPRGVGAPALFHPGAQRRKESVQRRHRPGQEVGLILLVLERRAEQFTEEGWVNLRAAVVMRADVTQIGAVGQGVLGNDIDIAAVEFLVLQRLAVVGGETLTEDGVGRAEAARIGATVKHRVLRHLRIKRFAVRPLERRCKHIMAEPVAEPVVALVAGVPVRQAGVKRHGGKEGQRNQQRAALPIDNERDHECQCDGHQQKVGVDRQTVLVPGKGPTDPIRQIGEADRAGGAKVMLARRIPEAKQGQHYPDNATRQAPKPKLLIVGGHEGCRQGQAVADQTGHNRMGRAQKDLDKVGGGLVRRRIEQNYQQAAKEDIHGSEGDEPGALALLHLEEEHEGHQRDEHVNPGELRGGAFDQHAQLAEEPARLGDQVGRVGLFVLAAADRMEEPFHCPGVTPLHRRICHARNGHIKVERNPQHPQPGHDQHRLPVSPQALSPGGQPHAGYQRPDPDGIEEEQESGLGPDVVEHVVAG